MAVHVGAVVKIILRSMHIQHEAVCDTLRFFVLVLQEGIIQIFKDRHIFRHGIFKVAIVDMTDTLVNDAFLIVLQPVLPSGDQVT